MQDFIVDRRGQIIFAAFQHFSLVIQCLILAAVIAVVLAALVYRNSFAASLANSVSAIGLTIPSFALLGLLIIPFGFGVTPAVIVVTFFATLPILRNAIVALAAVPPSVIESAKGLGMSRLRVLATVELPLAWPVILAGMRVSGQMVMGIAAVSAFVLGPGLGGFIFSGLARLGGAHATDSVVVGVIGVVILALVLDLALLFVGRLTISRGVRV